MKNDLRSRFNDDMSIVLCGEAGQGIQTVEHILTQALKLSGYHVFSAKEYMSRIRGGSNSTLVRASSNRVSAFVDRVDLLIPFGPGAVHHVQKRISSSTILLGEKKIYGKEYTGERAIDVPLSEFDTPSSRAKSTNKQAGLLRFVASFLFVFYPGDLMERRLHFSEFCESLP
jgi:Pyruvate/2-oxoacid:ferredoxin oxidoreductase gamma subunit